jgi:Zn-dependent M28 family amino/carboxypeptidase
MPFASRLIAFSAVLACGLAAAQQTPTPAAAPWWKLTTDLSNDEMQGRDTGTEAYQRAADYVAAHFKSDRLKPAGDNGTYFQRVPMHQVDLDTAHSSVELVDASGGYSPLALLYETTLVPRTDLPAHLDGDLVFIGYGEPPASLDLKGKIAVLFNNTPANLSPERRASFNGGRIIRLAEAGVAGIVTIDNPAATEPSHWPAAYARSVTIAGTTPPPQRTPVLGLRISAEAAPKLFAGTDANANKIIADAEKGLPLPSMPLARKLRVSLKFTEKDIASPNIIAVLPGSDPKLAPEYVAVSAHLDGYGYGTPVNGDNLYNGALDDAAYVATLLEMADNLHAKPPARSLLFCIFTGEEKGLLGSVYYTQHLTVPNESIVADFNLDQLRPIFSLNILTMEGITDSTLGDIVKQVAQQFHIELRADREPERNLFRRSDNYSFVRIGVPIASFVFGYNPGTDEERIYRDWYARRYHKPQDDLLTPIDWEAAVKFNDFYRTLVLKVADDASRPKWNPISPYAPPPAKTKIGTTVPEGCTADAQGHIIKCH